MRETSRLLRQGMLSKPYRPSTNPALASSRNSSSERHAAIYVGAVVALAFLLIQQGQVTVSDGRDMLAVSQSIVHHGTLAVGPQFGVAGHGGHYYAKYGIGLSLLAVPFVAIGDLVSRRCRQSGEARSVFRCVADTADMGFLAASLFRTTRRLGAGSRWAAVIAVGSVFGTYALPVRQGFLC